MDKKGYILGLIIFSIIITFSSTCKNSSRPVLLSDKETNVLKGEKFWLSGSLCPMDIQLTDSLIIIQNLGDQYWFHIYDKNKLTLIGKFGQEGRGPSEYLAPKMMNQRMMIRDSSYLVIFDQTLRRVSIVNILRAIENINYHPKTIRLNNKTNFQLSIISSGVLVNDSLFIGSSGNESIEGKYFCFDIYNNKMAWEPFYPIPRIPPRKHFLDDLYKNYSALRPNSTDIAAVLLFYKRIEILDKAGKVKRAIDFGQDKEPDFSNADSWPPKGSHEFFTSISVSQDYIYALDIDLDVDSHIIIDTVSLIRATWEDNGNLPDRFKLTPKIGKIAVDESNKKIYGTNFLSEYIYIFSLEN